MTSTEGGDGDYTVVLTSEPTGQVTVTPARRSGDADVTVSGAVTFTADDWSTPRTVTVSAAQDSDAADDTAVIGHTLSGADYGSVTAASVDVTVDDDETVSSGVILTVVPESVSEGANATTVTVTARLNGGTRGDATRGGGNRGIGHGGIRNGLRGGCRVHDLDSRQHPVAHRHVHADADTG